jgi:hypothetical protein
MEKRDRTKMWRGLFSAHMCSILNGWFGDIRDYVDSMQRLFRTEEKKLLNLIEKETQSFSSEGDEWYQIAYSQFKDSFPNIHTNSLFVIIWAEFEYSLKFVCRALANERSRRSGKTFRVPEGGWRKGSNLDDAKKFLKKPIGVNFPSKSVLWNEIKQMHSIRNAIVHNSGWLVEENKADEKRNKDNHKIRAYIQQRRKKGKESIILIEDEKKIQLRDEFIVETLDTMHDFLGELMRSISEWSEDAG